MTVEDIEPLNIAQCVCLRPKMYTANGTLAEVLALFDGYDLALRHDSSRASDTSPSHVLEWLNSGNTADIVRPQERMTRLLELYQSDEEALSALEKVASESNAA